MDKNRIKQCQKVLSLPASKQVLVDCIQYLADKMDDIPESIEEYSRVAEEVHVALSSRYKKELEGKPKEQKWKQVDITDAIKLANDGKY